MKVRVPTPVQLGQVESSRLLSRLSCLKANKAQFQCLLANSTDLYETNLKLKAKLVLASIWTPSNLQLGDSHRSC